MKKCCVRFIFLFQFFVSISNNIENLLFDPSLNILLYDDTCIYVTENSNAIYKMKVDEDSPKNLSLIQNAKNKTLIKLSNESFILFALNSNNLLSYYKYNINDNNLNIIPISTDLSINGNFGNHTIKYIDENKFLVYYIYFGQFYLHTINLVSTNKGGIKLINLESGYDLNHIECESYDGQNIFCVYSMIKKIAETDAQVYFTTISYYSFENIDQPRLGKNLIKKEIAGPSLLKIEYNNKKQFLICYYEINNEKNPSIYCQFFTVNENNLLMAQQTYFIGTTSYSQLNYENYAFQSAMHLERYDYTIYILLKFQIDRNNKKSILFVSSIDFNLIIPFYIDPNSGSEKLNILVSDKYILFLKNSGYNIQVQK